MSAEEEKKPELEEDDNDDEESVVDMEGVEMEEDNNGDDEGESTESDTEDPKKGSSEEAEKEKGASLETRKYLAAREKEDYEEAKIEQMKLMESESNILRPGIGGAAPGSDQERRFRYLLGQSEVFAHFLAGSVASEKRKGGRGGRKKKETGRKHRLTEAEEDSQLLKTAQLKRQTTRLEQQPSILHKNCKMHPYQLEGLNWLIKLHDHGLNGILADEMGLGKTLQTIALLAYLREDRAIRGPHIVVVPKSVVGNWMKEFRRWCPAIKVIKMLATKKERRKVIANDLPPDKDGRYKFDVLVTSYEGVLKANSVLNNISWEYCVIDEAHRIKNENSSLSRGVRALTSRFRVLLTGTPLQNNLHELWALLNFLLPDIFGDADQFDAWFSLSSSEKQENVIKKLHTVLRPFMLRRIKKDVALSLPPKKETKLFIGMTPLQTEWYKRVLRKDAHELNCLGGPDRVRLLNILMQLRKVCNHPYLFDGAEPGPPYHDGPHIWEASGKMMLLHKLLPKLKEKGSRVLIFSQMTRVLDILEDYCRYIKFDYCRIDGNTDGESRDRQMDVFNEPGSDKFVFLLSTRAGGLGINLATADIVILYDSDWNPQVDLQAMDRAHRIGQTKPVQVFRFITGNTVEEKIVERADRKLFLDAAVIQQGRLADKLGPMGKHDLMHMVKFGADEILSGQGGTYTDEDLDALITRGEERTNEINEKIKTDAKHNLANFTLSGDAPEGDLFNFDGKNYREENKDDGNLINLPQRDRKRNYDVDEYYREAMNVQKQQEMETVPKPKKKRRGPMMHDFQLFDKERLEKILNKERILEDQRDAQWHRMKKVRQQAKVAPSKDDARSENAIPGDTKEELLELALSIEQTLGNYELNAEEAAERDQLISAGFPEWTRKDFKSFTTALEKYGRYDIDRIVSEVTQESYKSAEDVKKYYISFWMNYRRIQGCEKILERIERGEKKIQRLRSAREAITDKVERHVMQTFGYLPGDDSNVPESERTYNSINEQVQDAWSSLKFNTTAYTKSRSGYQEQEDAFLLCMMYKHGYGAAERIRLEVRRAWQFRFNWFFKSRSAAELQKRCDFLLKVVEAEKNKSEAPQQLQQQVQALMTDVGGQMPMQGMSHMGMQGTGMQALQGLQSGTQQGQMYANNDDGMGFPMNTDV